MESHEIKLLNRYSEVSRALWDLLDDIDTLSDMLKPDGLKSYELFYKKVMEIQRKRHEYMESDGDVLTLILED